jgi:hypothetical protein
MADADKAAEQRSYDTQAAETMVNTGERAFKAKVGYKRAAPAKVDGKPAPAAPAAPAATVYENYQAK